MNNLCQESGCPYYNSAANDPSGYGCTRFRSVGQCPAVSEFGIDAGQSEYALYDDQVDPATFRDFMDRWFLGDRKYQSDLEFQREFPGELPFPSRAIAHPCQNAKLN